MAGNSMWFIKLERMDDDLFHRCLSYAKDRNKFTINEMQHDLSLDDEELHMIMTDHVLKNYFPTVDKSPEKEPKSAMRMLSLYGRGAYFNHLRTEKSLRLSQIAYYAAVAAFIASSVGAVAELLDLAVVDSVKIKEIDESLLDI